MKRRTFIQSSVLAVASTSLVNSAWAKESKYKNKIGLQLYTLRDLIFKDAKGVLKSVADLGYKELETFSYKEGKLFGLTVKEFGDYVGSLGMKTTSGHYGIDLMGSDKWEQACVDAKTLGQEYVVMPYLTEQYYKTIDDIKKVCATVNKGAEVAKKYGLRTQYHNHAFEFKQVEGKVMFDVLLQELDAKLVSFELDLFWTINAGYDPIQLFQKNPGRFEQWHVKDMDKNDKMKNADVGTGSIDFKKIFENVKLSGMKHFYIEHDSYPINSAESIKGSIKGFLSIL